MTATDTTIEQCCARVEQARRRLAEVRRTTARVPVRQAAAGAGAVTVGTRPGAQEQEALDELPAAEAELAAAEQRAHEQALAAARADRVPWQQERASARGRLEMALGEVETALDELDDIDRQHRRHVPTDATAAEASAGCARPPGDLLPPAGDQSVAVSAWPTVPLLCRWGGRPRSKHVSTPSV